MKNENIKIPFGIYEGQIIHISSAVSGREYECCECGSELIPVISNKIASHFRHKSKCKCDGGVSRVGGESPIHKYAKKIILEEKKVYIDEDNFIEFREVKEEYKINGTERIVDLYCVTNDYREMAIEIFYKHKVESDKVQELKNNKVRNVLEINIPDISNFRDDSEIREGIIKNFVREMLINTDIVEENKLRKELLDKFEFNLLNNANNLRKRMEEEKRQHKEFIERECFNEIKREIEKRERNIAVKERNFNKKLKRKEESFNEELKKKERALKERMKRLEVSKKDEKELLKRIEKLKVKEINLSNTIKRIKIKEHKLKELDEYIKEKERGCLKARQELETLRWRIKNDSSRR